MQLSLVLQELILYRLNPLLQPFLLLFLLAEVLIKALVHGFFGLGEPNEHVWVLAHFPHEVLQVEVVFAHGKLLEYLLYESWVYRC